MLRSEFIQFAAHLLRQESTFLKMSELAKSGLVAGLLTAPEAAAIEGRTVLPAWLAEGLGGHSAMPPEASLSPELINKGSEQSVTPPAFLLQSRVPKGFLFQSGRSPDVKVLSGRDGAFVIENFAKVAIVEGQLITELSDKRNFWVWNLIKERKPTVLPGKTLLAVVEGSSLLSHWLFDTLPKFMLVRSLHDLDSFDHVVVASNKANFHKSTFNALGIPIERTTPRGKVGPYIHCEEFTTVTDIRLGFLGEPWVYQSVASLFKSDDTSPYNYRRVFISRERAFRRKLINEQDLLPVLEKFGFKRIFAEDFSLSEMCTLMRDVTHVVAPHGAGLSNIAFCQAGTKVLEIFSAHISTEFCKISSMLKLKHFILQATGTDGSYLTEEQISTMSFRERPANAFCGRRNAF
jgi:capsular polysaccharide biosynthesis protein